jgi:hypothetical protein
VSLDPRFAFWRYPRRIERLAIHVLVLDEQLAQLGQTVGGLVADKQEADENEASYIAAFSGKTKAQGLETVGVSDQSGEDRRGA